MILSCEYKNMKPIFIPDSRIHWTSLSTHADVVYLEPHLDKVDWTTIGKNPNAMLLIEEHLEEQLDTLNWNILSTNPSVISLLAKPHLLNICEHKIDPYRLSENPNAIPFLETHPKHIIWFYLSGNPNAVPLLEKYPHQIEWFTLSRNPNAMHLLTANQDKINWHMLCCNPNPEAMTLLTNTETIDIQYIDWGCLSSNPNALPLLEQYPEKVIWEDASHNFAILPFLEKHLDQVDFESLCNHGDYTTPEVIEFLERHVDKLCDFCWDQLSCEPNAVPLLTQYPDKISWKRLSRNPGAIPLLEQYPEKISWNDLSANPNAMHMLFRLDHEKMRQQNALFKEELNTYVFDPDRMFRISKRVGLEMRTYLSMY